MTVFKEEERQKSLSVETGSCDVVEHLISQLKFKKSHLNYQMMK